MNRMTNRCKNITLPQTSFAAVITCIMGNVDEIFINVNSYMSHFSYTCKTEGENGISRLISETA